MVPTAVHLLANTKDPKICSTHLKPQLWKVISDALGKGLAILIRLELSLACDTKKKPKSQNIA